MKIFLITDTHFGHDVLVTREFRPNNFNGLIIKNLHKINEQYPNATLIHMGDVTLTNKENAKRWAADFETATCSLNKVLVRGNHDKLSDSFYSDYFGFTSICDGFFLRKYGVRIMISHKPKTDHGYFDINIHGHFHDNDHRTIMEHRDFDADLNEKHRLIALETEKYKPVELKTVVKKFLDEVEILNKDGNRIQI
jgi:calcineurin-like phosphoesterase family protein